MEQMIVLKQCAFQLRVRQPAHGARGQRRRGGSRLRRAAGVPRRTARRGAGAVRARTQIQSHALLDERSSPIKRFQFPYPLARPAAAGGKPCDRKRRALGVYR